MSPKTLNTAEKKKRKAAQQDIINGALQNDLKKPRKDREVKEEREDTSFLCDEVEEELGLDSLAVEEAELPWFRDGLEKPPYEPFIHLQVRGNVERIYVLFWQLHPNDLTKDNLQIRKKDSNTMELELRIPPIDRAAWTDIQGLEKVLTMDTKKERVLKFPLQMPRGYQMEVSSVCPYRDNDYLFGFSCRVIPAGEVEF